MARARACRQPGDLFRCTVFFAMRPRRQAPVFSLTVVAADQFAAAAKAGRRAGRSAQLRRIIVEAVT